MPADPLRQLLSSRDAEPAQGQHTKPCSDCPWARTALKGWLGTLSVGEWVECAHGETRMECHTKVGAQCAGAAIYRSNVCKSPRDATLLKLPRDTQVVFASHLEFLEHHCKKDGT